MITPDKLSSKRIIGYVIGTVPLVTIAGFFSLAYVNFFYDDLKLNDTLWIIGLVIYMVINATNDPLIGYLSDNTNAQRWGSRRIVYIKYFSPFLVISFILMWFPWSLDNQVIIFLHFVITVCAYETFFTIVVMTWYALLPDMTSSIHQRTKIGLISGIIGFLATIPTMIVPYIMNNRTLLQIGSIIVAALGIICYFFVVKLSKESPEFHHDKSPPFWKSIKQTLKSHCYICFMGYNFAAIMQLSIGLSYLFIYALILGQEGILYFFLIYIFIGYSSNILCMKLRSKHGIKRIMVFYMAMQIIGGTISFFIIINPALEWFLWIGVIWTSFFGGAGVFSTVLQTLPIDEDELKYGSRREGMFYGVNALFTMPAYSIGPIVATVILGLNNYVRNAPRILQPGSAILAVKALFFLVPQIFTLISLLFILLYPINRLEDENFQEKLNILHDQKKEKLSSTN
jgi:GPH family glycoside/pentoside/hexuronide:cation symporter